MAIENLEKAISNIYSDVNNKSIVLPRFQRGFVWPREKQINLVSSFVTNLPFGSLLCLNGRKGDFITRELCFSSTIDNVSDNVDYLLDGQQRLSTLRSVIYDLFEEEGIDNWKKTWDKMYSSLRNRWFLRVEPDCEEEDIFGYRDLKFKPFNRHTDTDIKDFLEVKRINKTKQIDDYFHPNFDSQLIKLDAKQRAQRKHARVNDFASQKIIPLYEINKGEMGIHNAVIDKIASDRAECIWHEITEKGISPQSILYFFCNVSSIDSVESAEEYYVSNESSLEEAISRLCTSLSTTWSEKLKLSLMDFTTRKIPIVLLDSNETHRAIAIFEAINQGGVGLSVFDLVVAKAASEHGSDLVTKIVDTLSAEIADINHLNTSFNLTDWSPEWLSVLDGKEPTKQFKEWFVNVLSLHDTCRLKNIDLKGPDAIKREKILSIEAKIINENAETSVKGITRALAFLNLRCGIIKADDIQFKLLLVVLAFFLIDDEIWFNTKKLNKLEYWYWIAVFTGRYTYRQNEHCIEDIKNLFLLLDNNVNKFKHLEKDILDFKGCSLDLLLRNSFKETEQVESNSIKQVMLQFVLSRSPYDFNSSNNDRLFPWIVSKNSTKLEMHHIIPLTGATKIEQSTKEIRRTPSNPLNSMLNMTFISRSANQCIKDRSAEDYLNQLDDISVNSHLIDFSSISEAKGDDCSVFLKNRFKKIKSAIQDKLTSLIQ